MYSNMQQYAPSAAGAPHGHNVANFPQQAVKNGPPRQSAPNPYAATAMPPGYQAQPPAQYNAAKLTNAPGPESAVVVVKPPANGQAKLLSPSTGDRRAHFKQKYAHENLDEDNFLDTEWVPPSHVKVRCEVHDGRTVTEAHCLVRSLMVAPRRLLDAGP